MDKLFIGKQFGADGRLQRVMLQCMAPFLLFVSFGIFAQEPVAPRVLGKLHYEKFELIVAKVDGIVSQVNGRAGHALPLKKPVVVVTSVDPTRSDQVATIEGTDLTMVQSYVRQGSYVKKHQPILKLASKSNLIATASVYGEKLDAFAMGKPVVVDLAPAGDKPLLLTGTVVAIYEGQGSQAGGVKVDIALNSEKCLSTPECEQRMTDSQMVLIQSADKSQFAQSGKPNQL